MTTRLTTTTWRGTASEQRDLLAALQRHCTCAYTQGLRTSVCAGHRMLVEDQRALDGLLFVRRLADRFRREEALDLGSPTGPASTTDRQALFRWAEPDNDHGAAARPQPSDVDYPFTVTELGRLAIYRAAIQAGFYTDFRRAGRRRWDRTAAGRRD